MAKFGGRLGRLGLETPLPEIGRAEYAEMTEAGQDTSGFVSPALVPQNGTPAQTQTVPVQTAKTPSQSNTAPVVLPMRTSPWLSSKMMLWIIIAAGAAFVGVKVYRSMSKPGKSAKKSKGRRSKKHARKIQHAFAR